MFDCILTVLSIVLFCFQEDYNAVHGGKWTVQNLRLFLEGTRGKEVKNLVLKYLFYFIFKSIFKF